jgi:hypothetical protein
MSNAKDRKEIVLANNGLGVLLEVRQPQCALALPFLWQQSWPTPPHAPDNQALNAYMDAEEIVTAALLALLSLSVKPSHRQRLMESKAVSLVMRALERHEGHPTIEVSTHAMTPDVMRTQQPFFPTKDHELVYHRSCRLVSHLFSFTSWPPTAIRLLDL